MNISASYRLLHFSPVPENGERICIGLWFNDGRRVSVEYDEKMSKLNCVAPGFDSTIPRILLDDLAESVASLQGSEAELAIRGYGPQLVASEPRRLLVPLTEAIKARLHSRFLFSRSDVVEERAGEALVTGNDDLIRKRLETYLGALLNSRYDIRRNVDLGTLFRLKPAIKRGKVALVVTTPHRLVVIDGVDLTLSKARATVNRVDRIAYAFWQFGRAHELAPGLGMHEMKRIGIVLNGAAVRDSAYREAHDYAVDRFKEEADTVVDTVTGKGRHALEEVLAD